MEEKLNINQHMTLSDRIAIEQGLRDGLSFRAIAEVIHKDPTTVSKEVRRFVRTGDEKDDPVNCLFVKHCRETHLCATDCTVFCKYCSAVLCTEGCSRWKPKHCEKLLKPPYVCSACQTRFTCKLNKKYYYASNAQKEYEKRLVNSRKGINMSREELKALNEIVSPLLLQRQSLSHIYANHGHEIGISRKTLYNYISAGILDAKTMDLPRKVRYKKRKKKARNIPTTEFKYRSGRTYKDFENFMLKNPELEVVEMDTVKGSRTSGNCLLTMMFRSSRLMLIFLLPRCTMAEVVKIFDEMTHLLGLSLFRRTFPVILTDNGSEFKDSYGLEHTQDGDRRTAVFYCDPQQSNQKARLEKNHEYIRYIIPKGTSMHWLTREHVHLMANHINSLARDSLSGNTPFAVAQLLLKKEVLESLGLTCVSPDQVQLNPALLRKK